MAPSWLHSGPTLYLLAAQDVIERLKNRNKALAGEASKLKRENSYSDAIISRLASVTSPSATRKASTDDVLAPILDLGERGDDVISAKGEGSEEARAVLAQVQRLQAKSRRLEGQLREKNATVAEQTLEIGRLRDALDEAVVRADGLAKQMKRATGWETATAVPLAEAQQGGTSPPLPPSLPLPHTHILASSTKHISQCASPFCMHTEDYTCQSTKYTRFHPLSTIPLQANTRITTWPPADIAGGALLTNSRDRSIHAIAVVHLAAQASAIQHVAQGGQVAGVSPATAGTAATAVHLGHIEHIAHGGMVAAVSPGTGTFVGIPGVYVQPSSRSAQSAVWLLMCALALPPYFHEACHCWHGHRC